MARKNKAADQEYHRRYYQEMIKTNPEKMEQRRAAQRERMRTVDRGDYNKQKYTTISVHSDKEIAALYKQKCKDLGIPYSQPIHEAIRKFVAEN